MLDEVVVGINPRKSNSGAQVPGRADHSGAYVAQDAHARYVESVLQGNVYTASTQAGVALTVGLSTTATGIILTNPPNSGKVLALIELLAALTTAPAGISTVGLQAVVTPQIAETTHTAALVVRNARIGNTSMASGKVDSSATLAATPVCVRAVPGGPVATGSVTSAYIKDEIAGAIILEPGTAIATFALTTAISALLTVTWEELPIAALP